MPQVGPEQKQGNEYGNEIAEYEIESRRAVWNDAQVRGAYGTQDGDDGAGQVRSEPGFFREKCKTRNDEQCSHDCEVIVGAYEGHQSTLPERDRALVFGQCLYEATPPSAYIVLSQYIEHRCMPGAPLIERHSDGVGNAVGDIVTIMRVDDYRVL